MKRIEMKKNITAKTPADLLDKIYKAEGWVRAEGEVRSLRAGVLYVFNRNNRQGMYIATRKEAK